MAHITYFTAISILSSTCLFLYGFFPMMNTSNFAKASRDSLPTQLSSHNSNLKSLNLPVGDLFRKHVDKMVFVVIDGLRYDFVSPQNMKYTWSKIKENECLVKLEVSSPTVTMPRLKSLMTGKCDFHDDNLMMTEQKKKKSLCHIYPFSHFYFCFRFHIKIHRCNIELWSNSNIFRQSNPPDEPKKSTDNILWR